MTGNAPDYRHLFAAFNRRDWRLTKALAMPMLAAHPDDAEIHFIAGLAELELARLGNAITLLRRALSLDSERSEFSANLARALSMAGARGEAIAMADMAMRSKPLSAVTLDVLGVVYTSLHAHHVALDAHRKAVSLAPGYAPYRYHLACSLIDTGQIDEAEDEINACLSIQPKFWRAHLALAHIRAQTPSTHHIARLEPLLSDHRGQPEACVNLHLALAKEHEDLGNYATSFAHLMAGKKIAREEIDYTIEQDQAIFSAIQSASLDLSDAAPHDSVEPIFVFGMPRTGTTLVERILSCHPEVQSAGEIRDYGIALRRASGEDHPVGRGLSGFDGLRHIDWHRVGELYLDSVRSALAKPRTTSRFIDKLPHNFLYAGFIAKTFPHARLICLRRHPVDTCLSNFRQHFAGKLPYYHYSFDLLDTGAYYLMFDRLMKHWQQMFPGKILEVSYEALVSQQRSTSQAILDFCGLPWDEHCLDFHRNSLPVSNASAIQVRSMMYETAVHRWHRYKPQLVDLCRRLEEAGICFE